MKRKHKRESIQWKNILNFKSIFQIILGSGLAVLALKGFMIPNHFMDGGVTGISLLIHAIFPWMHISIIIVTLNLYFIYLGYKKISKTFAIQTVLAITLLSLGLIFIEIPTIVTDKLLIAIFGGILIGTGIGLVIRSGGVIDGFEVIAIFTKRRTGFSNSEIILLFNTIIFFTAASQFGIVTVMYSIITYFTASRATSYVVDGIEEFTTMNIISSKQEEIKNYLVNVLGKGITVYKGERGYLPESFETKTDCEIIVTVISRLEINQIQDGLIKLDPKAFIYVQRIKEVTGGILKKQVHEI